MKILSFDVGIKNLAYCLIESTNSNKFSIIKWDVINLCGSEPVCNQIILKKKCKMNCVKLAKYKKNDQFF